MWLWLVALAWSGDFDGDTVDDAVDNCAYTSNADQADTNGDGYGDVCADPTATLGSNVFIARNVTISPGAVIGNDVVLLPRAYIGVDAIVGDGSIIGGRLEDATGQGPVRVLAQGLVARRAVAASGAEIGLRAAIRGEMREGSRLAADAVLGWRGFLGPLTQVGERSAVRGNVGSQSTLGSDVSTGGSSRLGHRVTVHNNARIGRRAQIGDDSVIGEGTVIGPRAELGQHVQVGDGARVRGDADLQDHVSIGEDAVLRRRTEVPSGVAIAAGTVTGAGTVTMSGSEMCVDSIDNDADGLVDCLDPDCASHFACATETACADGQDNDYDGRVDCADRDCGGQADCPGESDCTDGLDNNDSGAADCSDPSCFGAPGCTTELLCDDGLDNDGDGFADQQSRLSWDADPDCGTFPEFCRFHQYDNDGDGLVSALDPDCYGRGGMEICHNGVDDDRNGLIDCEDSQCAFSAQCGENCLDGLDNDGDGDVDCQDSDCLDEVCLSQRRVSGGQVMLVNSTDRASFQESVEGGGCVHSITRRPRRFDLASMAINFEDVEVRLRVPTTLGAFSSSTCVVAGDGGRVFAPHYASGFFADVLPDIFRVTELAATHIPEQVSSDCNWADEAREAGVFRLAPGAHFVRDVDDQPVVLNGLGLWDIGQPTGWIAESYVDSGVSSSRDNCLSVGTVQRHYDSAQWGLPAQTHTFLPPEP